MELYSFLTFVGGVLVGIGMAMLLTVLVILVWSKRGNT